MRRAYDLRASGPLSEMAIVDTFTKLIFGPEEEYSSSEELIIQAFRLVDPSVALDSHEDMGRYLRALGVAEMIQLVTRVELCLGDGVQAVVQVGNESAPDRRAQIVRINRTGH